MPYRKTVLSFCLLALFAQVATASQTAALHLKNNAGVKVDAQMPAFEDLISSYFTGKGLRIITARSALDSFSGNSDSTGNELMDSSTLQRLAQSLGADFALSATITSYSRNDKSFDAYGVKGTNSIHNLRVSYTLFDVSDGSSVIADTIKVSKTIRNTRNLSDDGAEAISEMLDNAASQLADAYVSSARQTDLQAIADSRATKEVHFFLQVATQSLSIPNVQQSEDGSFQVLPSYFTVEPADFVVELDGLAIGSAGSKTEFSVLPGIHRVKITREGYIDWERMVNIREGMSLKVDAAQTSAEIAKTKGLVGYFQHLSNQTTLTNAEAEVLKGKAQSLRQSGYRMDTQVRASEVDNLDIHSGDTPATLDFLEEIFSN